MAERVVVQLLVSSNLSMCLDEGLIPLSFRIHIV